MDGNIKEERVPIILVYSMKRPELVDQTLRTLRENTAFPYKLYSAEDKEGGLNYLKLRNELASKVNFPHNQICFIDDDLYFNRSWLTRMLHWKSLNKDVKVIGGATWFNHKIIEERKGLTISNIIPGACWLMRREVWEEYGPFDINKRKTYMFIDRVHQGGGKVAFLNNRELIVHCGISSLINTNGRSKMGEEYIKNLADKVGAITG